MSSQSLPTSKSFPFNLPSNGNDGYKSTTTTTTNTNTSILNIEEKTEYSSRELPNDLETLKSIIDDLNRRLQNAQHSITAHKEIARLASLEAEQSKQKLETVSRHLRLELAKNANNERKHKREVESKRYEDGKVIIENLQHELRILTVDQQMTKSKIKLTQIQKLKEKIAHLQHNQQSQIKLMEYYKERDEYAEKLCKACQLGEIEECEDLIKRGICVNDMDSASFLPIHYASSYGSYEIVKMLLDAGSDPGSYITGKNPMEIAGRYGHHRLIQLFVDYGGDVNDAGSGGNPPLLSCVAGGYLSCVEEILSFGCHINDIDKFENNCLHTAASIPDSGKIIEVLIQYGADMMMRNKDGYTPLQIAHSKANHSAIEALERAKKVMDD